MEAQVQEVVNWVPTIYYFIVGATAIVAIALSAKSIRLSAATAAKQIEHNRNSVRPVLAIRFGDYNHELYVKIMNIGLGPLFVQEFKVTSANDEKWKTLIDATPDLPDEIGWQDFIGPLEGQPIGAGETRLLIQIRYDEKSDKYHIFQTALDEIRHALKDLTIEVRYTDIYGNEMPVCVRDLSWFRRLVE